MSMRPLVCIIIFAGCWSSGQQSLPTQTLAQDALSRIVSPASDAANTGVVANLDLPDEPDVLWKFADGKLSFGDIVAHDGLVIALSHDESVIALDSITGALVWERNSEFQFQIVIGLSLTCMPDFDAVLVGDAKGLRALDRKTGADKWKIENPMGMAGPCCVNERVYAASPDGNLYAFDLQSGKELWKHDYASDRPDDPEGFDGNNARMEGTQARPSAASTDGETIFISVFDQCRTIAVEAATGERRWAFQSQGWMWPRPTVGPRDVIVGSQDRRLYCIDKAMGHDAWFIETGNRVEGPAAITKDMVLFGSCDGKVYAVGRDSGEIKWTFQTEREDGKKGAPLYSQPLVSDQTVYVAAIRGKVYALELETGKLKWSMQPSENSELDCQPQVDSGRLFLSTRKKSNGEGESAIFSIGRR